MCDLYDVIKERGNQCFMVAGYSFGVDTADLFCANRRKYELKMRKDILISRITGTMGYRYGGKTKKLVKWIDDKKPDIIHLHNIHGDWVNLYVLFDYLKKSGIPVVWTLHDCWSFTGRCSHFEDYGCYKWKTGCNDCSNTRVYPITYFFDRSERMWKDKKKWFSDIKNMVIVTPSFWLKRYVQESFLKGYPIEVIHNGIDLDVFSYKSPTTEMRKKIILGVASSWGEKKGLKDFIEIDKRINHEEFQIVLIGLNDRQIKTIPSSIYGIKRTHNKEELVEWYSKADVFVNPTYQDNFPTVNMEAIACGTPVITYRTGGSPESIGKGTGIVVEKGDIEALYKAIMQVIKDKLYNRENCIRFAQNNFSKQERYKEYMQIYNLLAEYGKDGR